MAGEVSSESLLNTNEMIGALRPAEPASRPSITRYTLFDITSYWRMITRRTTIRRARNEEIDRMIAEFRIRLKHPWWLIVPESKAIFHWEIIIYLTLIYTAVITPFEAAMSDGRDDDRGSVVYMANRMIDVINLCDLIICFCTGYFNDRVLVTNFFKISWRYFTGWFFVDLIATIPYDLVARLFISLGILHTQSGRGLLLLRLLRMLRILRLLKLNRVAKPSSFHRNLLMNNNTLSSSSITLLYLAVEFLVFAHWMSCIWLIVADIQAHKQDSWMDSFAKSYLGTSDEAIPGSWIATCSDECESEDQCNDCNVISPFKKYCAALYWSIVTITTVGYGDVLPTNSEEMIVCFFALILAAFFWAYILGVMSSVVCTGDPLNIEYDIALDTFNKYMAVNDYPRSIRRRIRAFIDHSRYMAQNEVENALLEKMSTQLKAEVIAANMAWIYKLKMFTDQKLHKEFIGGISDLLIGKVYEPQENVAKSTCLIVVAHGVVCAKLRGLILTAGDVWGEDFILENTSLHITGNLCALTYAEILMLRRRDFFRHLEHFPTEKKLVRRAQVKMAVIRGIVQYANRKRDEDAVQIATRNGLTQIPVKSHDISKPTNTEEQTDTHIILANPDDEMWDIISQQGQMIDKLSEKMKKLELLTKEEEKKKK